MIRLRHFKKHSSVNVQSIIDFIVIHVEDEPSCLPPDISLAEQKVTFSLLAQIVLKDVSMMKIDQCSVCLVKAPRW